MEFVTQQFLAFAKAHPFLTTSNVLLSMTFPIDDLLVPYLSGKIVNLVQEKKPWLKYLVMLMIVLIGMQLFYTTTYWHDAILFPRLQNHIRNSMLADIIQHFQQSETDIQTGEIMSRLVKIPMTTVTVFEQFKNYLGTYVLSFLVTATYIMFQNWVIGTVLIVAGLIAIYAIVRSPNACRSSAMTQEHSLEQLDEETEDVLRNLPAVYTSDQITRELGQVERMGKRFETYYMETTSCTIRRKIITVCILSAMLIFFGWYSYTNIRNGKMKVGLFVSIFIIIIQWYNGLGWLSTHIRELVMEWGILASHTQLFKDQTNTNTTDTGQDAKMNANASVNKSNKQSSTISRGVQVKNVVYCVTGRPTPILNDVSLTIEEGERVGIVGHVGSGKTTMLKIIARLIKPTSGEVYIDGQPISRMSLTETRKLVGYVQQHPLLFNRTIYENIVYGNESKVTRSQVTKLVNSLGLETAFANLPLGLETKAGKNGSVLSGGQKQLVQMMRLIITDPKVVVLDEVTASLDSDTKQKLFAVLDVALKGKTTIIVTHDQELMQKATRLIHFQAGEVIEPVTKEVTKNEESGFATPSWYGVKT